MQAQTSILALATLASAACASSPEPIYRQRNELRAATAAPIPTPTATPTTREPAALDELLARWDAAPAGKQRRALAEQVDRAAGQRYATVSRLFWYTDLEAAQLASVQTGKPIVSLRMLGRLDEDYSCANSRFFRVALYANRKVSAYLRDNFILHWSSERPAPRITVDYGDGRVMHRTIGGNSAHYLLDSRGRPIDVLPGLYGPEAFVAALDRALPLARRAAKLDDAHLVAELASYHQARVEALARSWTELDLRVPRNGRMADAQKVATTKAIVEMPLVQVAIGEEFAQQRWNEMLRGRLATARGDEVKLDASSRQLIEELAPARWQGTPAPLSGDELAALIARFERDIAVDTEFNEYGIHYIIHAWLAQADQPPMSFETLNRQIYDSLFLTPAADPWLGMSAEGTFTGLPGDGILAGR